MRVYHFCKISDGKIVKAWMWRDEECPVPRDNWYDTYLGPAITACDRELLKTPNETLSCPFIDTLGKTWVLTAANFG